MTYMTPIKMLIILVFFVSTLSRAQDVIHGTLYDQFDQPVSGLTMVLESESGEQWFATSDQQGYYSFGSMPEDWYYLHPATNGLDVMNTACAFEFVYHEPATDLFYPLQINTLTGIAVEFGTVSPGTFSTPTLSLNGNTFELSLNLDIQGLFSTTPDRLVVQGVWLVPGSGLLQASAVGAQISGVYAGTHATATATNLNGECRLELARLGWPYLDRDGQAARFSFGLSGDGLARLANSPGDVSFCATYTLYRGSQRLAEGSTYWQGRLN